MPDNCSNYNEGPEGTKPTPCEPRDNVHAPLLFNTNLLQSENHMWRTSLESMHTI